MLARRFAYPRGSRENCAGGSGQRSAPNWNLDDSMGLEALAYFAGHTKAELYPRRGREFETNGLRRQRA